MFILFVIYNIETDLKLDKLVEDVFMILIR